MIIFHLVENFRKYDDNSSYTNIYEQIVKEYLTKVGKDREEINTQKDLNELLLIASSLATYMMLDRIPAIDSNNLAKIASECYKINDKPIVADDLKTILNTALFKKEENKFTFFHKSIQEYLVAYFLANKKLSNKQLKELLASDLRFYEEFEEIVVYLTNIKEDLFDDFVEFDPFIFKRHPSLTENQQEKLLIAILNKYKVDFSQIRGRGKSFEGTTLVKFEKIDNLIELLDKYATLKEHGYYLMKLLEYNYNNELKKYMFELFERGIYDKKILKEVIRGNFIDNYDLNVSLYEFLKKEDLLEKDIHAFMMSFEAELFSSLYGIKYKYKYGFERITERTEINFDSIIPLLDFVPKDSLQYIAPYLLKEDVKKWFLYVIDKYDENKYNPEFMCWAIHAVLKHCDTTKSLKEIATKIKEKKIYIHTVDKKEMKLDFTEIKNIFWEVYFKTELLQEYCANEITSLYNITLNDIIEITDKYPIENHIRKYTFFRRLGDDVDKFLMQNEEFNIYMQNIWKKEAKRQNEWEEKRKERFPDIAQKEENEKEHITKCIDRFGTKKEQHNDYYDIFIYALENSQNSITEIDQFLQELLSEKYPNYILRIKEKFKADILYKDIKNNLLSDSISDDTKIYNYLFKVSNQEELAQLVKTKEDYIKFFWHTYKNIDYLDSDKFTKISEVYFECFIMLVLDALQISINQSNGKKIDNYPLFIESLINLKKFNKDSMKPIIHYLINDKNIILNLQESDEKTYLLDILALDKNNYSYILGLMFLDKDNMSIYLKNLLKVDANKALDDFYKIYKKEKRYVSIWKKIANRLTDKKETGYNNPTINPKKINLYFMLMRAIKGSQTSFDNIEPKYFENILIDYYEFFSKYERPKGGNTPDIYNDMYSLINSIWYFLESSILNIQMLEELTKSKNIRLSEQAKYTLTKAYEQQAKDRNYPNSYYKKLFDKDEKMDETTINISGHKNNIAINSTNISQTIDIESKAKIDLWWLYSTIAGLITILIIWWSYDSWYYGILGGLISYIIVWKLNPKFRFRNIGYALLSSGILSNILSFSGVITISSNDWIYGTVKFDDNNISLLLILSSIPFFILDYKVNKNDN
jgi:hypothetical protein